MEEYFRAKSLLFQSVADAGTGQMIINADDSWGRKLITKFASTGRVTGYGYGVGIDFRATDVRYDLTGTSFELTARGRSFLVKLPLIGDFNVYNSLAAIAAAHALGLNLRESINHLKEAPQVPGRLERVTEGGRMHVFVDYAHTPDALVNVLRTLRALRPQRIITVFGCGGDRDRTKRAKMARAAEEGSDICVLTSDNPRSEDPSVIIADARAGFTRPGHHEIVDRREAIYTAIQNAWDGDIVLIAGKGHETYQEVHGQRTPFDDRRIAKQCLFNMKEDRA
jgi:UDP-N-acetylmuramoyl-L-alanyl-D-glutamate--2,6-diaminopimelate ligase